MCVCVCVTEINLFVLVKHMIYFFFFVQGTGILPSIEVSTMDRSRGFKACYPHSLEPGATAPRLRSLHTFGMLF